MGLGSIFNIAGNFFLFNYSKTEAQADAKAIENDWGMIGNDLKDTILNSRKKTITNSQVLQPEEVL